MKKRKKVVLFCFRDLKENMTLSPQLVEKTTTRQTSWAEAQ